MLYGGYGAKPTNTDTFTGGSELTREAMGSQGQFGYYHDYSGRYLLGHRFYDSFTGRFVTRDPIGYQGGINLYGFAGNNPVNEIDPDGYSPAGDAAGVVGLVPGPIGEAANLASGLDSLHDGDYLGAALSLGGEVPGLGEIATGAKILRAVNRLRKAERAAKDAEEVERAVSGYGHLKDPRGAGPGKRFTTKQQNEVYKSNMERNGGVLRDDETGKELVRSKKSMGGVKNPPTNEAQVDHIIPRRPRDSSIAPGTNSYSNARVISRERNRAKSNL